MAQKRHIRIGLEYHENTLTDTLASTQQLLQSVESNNLQTFWQPPHTHDHPRKVAELQMVLPYLANVHVFHWHPENKARFPLAQGESDWRAYLALLQNSERDHVLSLEFVKDDNEAQYLRDAETLQRWLSPL
jgi:sugar phosphate isomerase/epimerase